MLGLPANATMALMVGAMMIHNVQPGPQVMTSNPALFWGLICSMWIGNLMLLVLNLPLIGMWIKILRVPYRLMFPAILLFCAIGVYSLQNNTVDVLLTIPFGLLGYVFAKLECEPAPLLLGFVLGPMLEENFTRAMLVARGSATIFFTRPLSLSLLLVAGILLGLMILPAVRKKREEVFAAEAGLPADPLPGIAPARSRHQCRTRTPPGAYRQRRHGRAMPQARGSVSLYEIWWTFGWPYESRRR